MTTFNPRRADNVSGRAVLEGWVAATAVGLASSLGQPHRAAAQTSSSPEVVAAYYDLNTGAVTLLG